MYGVFCVAPKCTSWPCVNKCCPMNMLFNKGKNIIFDTCEEVLSRWVTAP